MSDFKTIAKFIFTLATLELYWVPQVTQWCRFDPWVRKIPLEKEMVAHSSILAWKIPWREESKKLQFMRLQKSQIQLSN